MNIAKRIKNKIKKIYGNNERTNKYIEDQQKLLKYKNKAKILNKKNKTDVKIKNKIFENDFKIDKYQTKINKLISKNIFGSSKGLEELDNKIKKYGNARIIPSKVISSGMNHFTIIFNKGDYDTYNRNTIKKIGNKISTYLKNQGLRGSIQTCLNYDGIIRSSVDTKIGNDIQFFNPSEFYDAEDKEEFTKEINNVNKFRYITFYVSAQNHNARQGGNSNNNDCLWFCLNNAIPQYNIWEKPEDLKKILNLRRDEKIDIKEIPKIEKALKHITINVYGDYIYTSLLENKLILNLKLTKSHYQIYHALNRKVQYISYHEKRILMYDKMENIGYDGEKIIEIDRDYYNDIMNFKTEYILIPRTKALYRKGIGIKEDYEKYINMAENLKIASNGELNLNYTGTIGKLALKILDETTKHITPENIEFDEAIIIQNGVSNGYIFNEKYEGEAYKGDFISMYPSIYSNNNSLIPIKRGIFKKLELSNIEDMNSKMNGSYAYGLYKYNIYMSGDKMIDRWFRFKPIYNDEDEDFEDDGYFENNWYSSIDLLIADKLGLKKELVLKCKYNALLYPRSHCLTGHQVFNQYMEKIYPLKEKNIEGGKLLLNILSGSLGQINKFEIITKDDDDRYYNLDDLGLTVIKQTRLKNVDGDRVICADKDNYYACCFARFKPFMLALARKKIFDIGYKNNEFVKKVYIDSIISTKPLEYAEGLGKFKFEYYNPNINIINNKKEIKI